jgi:hypothetical protein
VQLALTDWFIIGLYFLFNLAIGFYYKRRAGRTVSKFFLSGRNVACGWPKAAERMNILNAEAVRRTKDDLPLTPAGLAKLNRNHSGKGPRADVRAKGNDPLSGANVPGLLRTATSPY